MRTLTDIISPNIPCGARVLCALSGGADSTAMTAALVELSAALRLTVAAAHYHHGLRGADADGDLLFCRELCAHWGIPLYHERGDAAALSRDRRLSRGLEADGRLLRYTFLEQTAREQNMDYICTAHNAGDNAETMLLNLIRGAGLDGLAGIPRTRGVIIRPMLDCTREMILGYLAQNGLSFRQDASNDGDVYRRNRIRRHVMPLLAQENPALNRTLRRSASLLAADAEYLNTLAARELERIRRPYDASPFGVLDNRACPRVEAAALAALPPPLSGRVIRHMAAEAAGLESFPDLSLGHTGGILALCGGKSHAKAAALPRGLAAEFEYGCICVRQDGGNDGFQPVELRFGERAALPELGLAASWQKKPTNVNNLVYSFCVKSDMIKNILRIRPRRPGDRIDLRARGGARSLQNLFVNAKIPRRLRGLIPVVESGGVIAGAYGFGAGAGAEGGEDETVLMFLKGS